jgi:MoxR-like ATPase
MEYKDLIELDVPCPTREELHTIVDRTTTDQHVEPRVVASRQDILEMQALVRRVPIARHVQDYAIRVLQATHPESEESPPLVKRFVRTGASPRGVQAILLASKIGALFDGRFAASIEDVKSVAAPALRHRVLLSFEGEAEGVRPDAIVQEILDKLAPGKA